LQSYLRDLVVLIDSHVEVVDHREQIILAGNKYAHELDGK
jgi:hypothetical protein